MQKFNQTYKQNPLYEADAYKVGHKEMLAPGTTREYFTWIPRNLKYMPVKTQELMVFGSQLGWAWIHSNFQEHFFDVDKTTALKFVSDMSLMLTLPYDGEHFEDLHDLGYLPVEIRSLDEGTFTGKNIPHLVGETTVDGYAWLGLFLETFMSKVLWRAPIAATIGFEFKKRAYEAIKKTDSRNLFLADFVCHDFHSRGGDPFTSLAVGLGHAVSNMGSDTLNVIPAARYFYNFPEDKTPIYSVNASEHSVTCTGIFYYKDRLERGLENQVIEDYYAFDAPSEGSVEEPDYLAIAEMMNLADWLEKFPKGILSVVSDTMDLWKLITHVLPRLKDIIMARDGKLVIRPDSGNPVDIMCGSIIPGKKSDLNYRIGTILVDGIYYEDCGGTSAHRWIPLHRVATEVKPSEKGVVELLGEIFGTTISAEGYKVLDSHIGVIYGDSINIDRQERTYARLEAKGFAASNVVLGIGSYTYVYMTRDTAGFAAKGAWFETVEHGERKAFDIYKDPVTDSGTKKSLKGFQFVYEEEGEIKCESQVSYEKAHSEENLLKVIYKNGEFTNLVDFDTIRERVNNKVKND